LLVVRNSLFAVVNGGVLLTGGVEGTYVQGFKVSRVHSRLSFVVVGGEIFEARQISFPPEKGLELFFLSIVCRAGKTSHSLHYSTGIYRR